jgi:hypothetical protein
MPHADLQFAREPVLDAASVFPGEAERKSVLDVRCLTLMYVITLVLFDGSSISDCPLLFHHPPVGPHLGVTILELEDRSNLGELRRNPGHVESDASVSERALQATLCVSLRLFAHDAFLAEWFVERHDHWVLVEADPREDTSPGLGHP